MRALPPALRYVSPVELAERLKTERRGVPFALYLDGDGRQRIVELGGRALCIGREPSSEIPLTWDTEVSRSHAVLERVGAEWTLVDDGLSRNGSFVNGHRIRGRQRLADGDTIKVGRTLILFAAAGTELVPTETTRDAAPPELSPAQRRVLVVLCQPMLHDAFAGPPSNREIAEQLVISVETVKSHLRALFELFGIEGMPQNRKRAELVRRALERGVGMVG